MRRLTLIAVPYLWLLALFLVPFLIVVKISLSDTALAIPPYTPELDLREGWAGVKEFFAGLDFENFEFLASDDAVLDEEALRELVADIVRQELQGALGERITRNVRKLVRREIHRALSAQDFD